jgi:hypothetical protein
LPLKVAGLKKFIFSLGMEEAMDLSGIAGAVSSAASVIVAIATLAYWLGRKFAAIDGRFAAMEKGVRSIREEVRREIEGVRGEIGSLRSGIYQFSEALLNTLGSKGYFSQTEVGALRGLAKALFPSTSSKYYTKEVAKKLMELLDKDPKDFTLADVDELNEIADTLYKEYFATNRKDLANYAELLRFYGMAIKVVYIYPKLVEASDTLWRAHKEKLERKEN